MAAPWEKYQPAASAQPAGPWAKYGGTTKEAAPDGPVTTAKTDRLPSTVNTGEDIARSALSGLQTGTEATLGQFGTANELSGKLASWIATKLGAGEDTASAIGSVAKNLSPTAMLPSANDIHQVTAPVIGEAYKPKTKAGEYTERIAEFAPNAIAGPGGVVRKAAMTVVPAVTSQAAGDLAEKLGFEGAKPYAQLAGALVGGAASAGRAPTAAAVAAEGAPTTQALKTEADNLYGTLRKAGIKYDPNAFAMTIHSTTDKLLKAGYRPSVAPQAFSYLDDLSKSIGHSPDFDDVNGLIQVLGTEARAAAKSPDGAGRAAALHIVRDGLMKFEERAPLTSQVPMPAAQMNQVRQAARQTAFQRIKGRTLDGILQDAETYSAGQEAGVRNGINNLLRSERGKQMFNGEERKALLEVAHGRKALQTLSKFGIDLRKFGGNATLIPTLGASAVAGAAHAANLGTGGLAGAGLLAAGTITKELSPRLTSKAFEQASAAVRSGKLKDPSVMNKVSAEKIKANIRRLLAAGSGAQALNRQ